MRHIHMCKIRIFIRQLSTFHEMPQVSQTHKYCNFKSIIGLFQTIMLSYKFYARDMLEMYFFFYFYQLRDVKGTSVFS